MPKIKFNEANRPYYSDDFIKGFECGTERQYKADQKTGHWIMTGDYLITASGNVDYVKCSCCREYSLEKGDYCPNCGARMGVKE